MLFLHTPRGTWYCCASTIQPRRLGSKVGRLDVHRRQVHIVPMEASPGSRPSVAVGRAMSSAESDSPSVCHQASILSNPALRVLGICRLSRMVPDYSRGTQPPPSAGRATGHEAPSRRKAVGRAGRRDPRTLGNRGGLLPSYAHGPDAWRSSTGQGPCSMPAEPAAVPSSQEMAARAPRAPPTSAPHASLARSDGSRPSSWPGSEASFDRPRQPMLEISGCCPSQPSTSPPRHSQLSQRPGTTRGVGKGRRDERRMHTGACICMQTRQRVGHRRCIRATGQAAATRSWITHALARQRPPPALSPPRHHRGWGMAGAMKVMHAYAAKAGRRSSTDERPRWPVHAARRSTQRPCRSCPSGA
jgi:hypothetical protein